MSNRHHITGEIDGYSFSFRIDGEASEELLEKVINSIIFDEEIAMGGYNDSQ